MRRVRKLTTMALATLGVLAFMSAPALAGQGYEAVTGHFGEPCKVGENPCGPGKFKEPTALAVNDTTEDVYVVDSGNDRVEYFSFNATTKAYEYAGQFDGSTTPAKSFLDPNEIAVNNDPSSAAHGDVYVADAGHDVIDRFSATGAYEAAGQLTGGCETAGETPPSCNGYAAFTGLLDVAVDPSGDVYVYEAEAGEVYEFSDTGNFLEKFSTHGEVSMQPGFAVDSSGNVYSVRGGEPHTRTVNEYEKGTGNRTQLTESAKPVTTLAIIAVNNDLLLDEGSIIDLFKSPITKGAQPLLTFPSTGLSESAGIAVNGANGEGTIYASQRGADDVDIFATGAPEAPKIVSESASSVSIGQGDLTAVIEPGNSETTYSFEYSTEVSENGSGEKELAGTITTISGEAPIPAEFGEQEVTVPGLQMSRYKKTFYYRAIAKNNIGTTVGKVQAYTKLPLVENEKVSDLTSTSAKLEATVNPVYVEETGYAFEYATSEAAFEKGEGTQIPGGTLGEEINEPVAVSAEIASLTPGQTYYYRVVAENKVTEETNNAHEGKPVVGKPEPFEPYAPPAVTTGEAQNITRTTGTLSGEVDPEGAETTYYFEYISKAGFQAALAKGAANPEEGEAAYRVELAKGAPSPYAEGETTTPLSAGAGDQAVAIGPIPADGLLPGETYHYALVAMNKFDIRSIGSDHTFKTGTKVLPGVSTGGASGVSQNAATLSGTVTTNGLQTNYGFEIGTSPGVYGPATGLGAIGGAQTEEVHVTLGELEPGTTYYYRVEATNADGTVPGQPVSFTTPGFPTLIAPPASPPLIAYTAPAFPKEEKAATTTTKTLTNKEKLAKALKTCKKDKSKSKRTKCEAAAHKKYPVASKRKKKGKK